MSWACCIKCLERCLPRNDIAQELRPYLQNSPSHIQPPPAPAPPLPLALPPLAPAPPPTKQLDVPLLTEVDSHSSYDSVEALVSRNTAPIVLVYTSIANHNELRVCDPVKMADAKILYQHIVRSRLMEYDGYEVDSQSSSSFLLAFRNEFDASKWCMDVQKNLLFAAWNKTLVAQYPQVGEELDRNKKLVFRGLRVRMGIHLGENITATRSGRNNNASSSSEAQQTTTRVLYTGRNVNLTKAITRCAHGGQIVMSEAIWLSLKDQLVQLGSAVVEDLGQHVVMDSPIQLMQLLPRELEGRRFPKFMSQEQLTPGMGDAPSISLDVTMVFTFVVGARQLILSDTEMAVKRIEHFCSIARDLLRQFRGYECQELQGDFMLAFYFPKDAVMWCGEMQKAIEIFNKSSTESELQNFSVSMGIETGPAVSVGPHKTSGRADYFGNIVNQTARIAKASNGGQILLGGAAWNTLIRDPNSYSINDTNNESSLPSSYIQFFFICHGWYLFKGITSSTLIIEAAPAALGIRKFTVNAKKESDELSSVYLGNHTEVLYSELSSSFLFGFRISPICTCHREPCLCLKVATVREDELLANSYYSSLSNLSKFELRSRIDSGGGFFTL